MLAQRDATVESIKQARDKEKADNAAAKRKLAEEAQQLAGELRVKEEEKFRLGESTRKSAEAERIELEKSKAAAKAVDEKTRSKMFQKDEEGRFTRAVAKESKAKAKLELELLKLLRLLPPRRHQLFCWRLYKITRTCFSKKARQNDKVQKKGRQKRGWGARSALQPRFVDEVFFL